MKEKKITDATLIAKFRKGSMEAFEELLERYESKIYNLAMRFTRNQEDAEEVLQDVFTTLYQKLDGFKGNSAFSSWLYRIIVNAAFMKLRKRKQNNTVAIEDLAPAVKQQCLDREVSFGNRSDLLSINKEMRDIIEAALNKLPDQYRAVFVLRDVDGLSNQEVSEILDLSIPAVKSRLHRSRLMLRKRLQTYWDDFTGKRQIIRAKLLAQRAAEVI
ncbi:MAG: sigma-70 family RNA polymerase sigma factor [Oligoflexia bacterium]|nr:sigma-70 family RNA polymerase sigma factor [Oligoflexia bacterium]